jgi:hypothetical protein
MQISHCVGKLAAGVAENRQMQDVAAIDYEMVNARADELEDETLVVSVRSAYREGAE